MNRMKIIDAHCDVLWKMWEDSAVSFDRSGEKLHVTLPRLHRSGVFLQFFAIFIEKVADSRQFYEILRSVDLFYSKIINHQEMMFVKSREDLQKVMQTGRIGALLTLEGVDGLLGDFLYLKMLYLLGVRSVGITWNYANWAGDGVLEPRKGGLTKKGRELVKNCAELGIIIDVAHLSEKGFWDVIESSAKPVIASHSNAYAICSHPRNLNDEQIRALIATNGRIGLNFVPKFVSPHNAGLVDLLRHIDHICGLGGEDIIGWGSDFDGIKQPVAGISHAGEFDKIYELMTKHYNETFIERIFYMNWLRYLEKELPSGNRT